MKKSLDSAARAGPRLNGVDFAPSDPLIASVHAIPQRQSLVGQTVAWLVAEIQSGKWEEWLPSERSLAESLIVSRNTLRAALAEMQRSGIIQPVHGEGNRILARAAAPSRNLRSRDVALLMPEPLERLRPATALWINELRAMLNEVDCRLHEFSGGQYFRGKPAASLQKLTRLNSHGCWVLVLSNEVLQRWFLESGLPCMVAGSCFSGVDLPAVDLDHRAMCRHAAGVLLGLGHRRIALLTQRVRRAGDVASEEGFIEGIHCSQHPDAEPVIAHHDTSVEGVSRTLLRLMRQKSSPTALLVANSNYYLTVTSQLAQIGCRVPQNISVVSRDDDPFLSFLLPRPARYTIPSHSFARRLVRPIIELLEGRRLMQREIRIMPKFIRGDSLAAPESAPRSNPFFP